jgi:chromosomal replication initiation ATPase DnaA
MDFYDIAFKMLESMELDAERIFSESRKNEDIQIRHAVLYVLSEQPGFSFSAIGRAFGISHSTVIHAARQTGKLIYQQNTFIKKLTERFTNYLKEHFYE